LELSLSNDLVVSHYYWDWLDRTDTHTFIIKEFLRVVAVLKQICRWRPKDGNHLSKVMGVGILFVGISRIKKMSLLEKVPRL
jgi:hypothetical protein